VSRPNLLLAVRYGSPPSDLTGANILEGMTMQIDGEICRQVLLHSDNPKVAGEWLEKLKAGKRRHVAMLMDHTAIWSAMKTVARYPGLWQDIKIGNFAKHLAAHCDDAIVSYWNHIHKIWSAIFFELEVDIPLLDVETVRTLQYMAPRRSKVDQEQIVRLLQSKKLFPGIHDENHRAKLYRNITSQDVVIPSILTFDENIRYITIGVKILERHILPKEHAPRKARSTHQSTSFIKRLSDWKVNDTIHRQSVRAAFVALLVDALRNFASLSSETPLQDIKGQGMIAAPNDAYISQLCSSALSYGFSNQKIQQGKALGNGRSFPFAEPVQGLGADWRGGKPGIRIYRELQSKPWSKIRNAHLSLDNSSAWVLRDILLAFFDYLSEESWEIEGILAGDEITFAMPPLERMARERTVPGRMAVESEPSTDARPGRMFPIEILPSSLQKGKNKRPIAGENQDNQGNQGNQVTKKVRTTETLVSGDIEYEGATPSIPRANSVVEPIAVDTQTGASISHMPSRGDTPSADPVQSDNAAPSIPMRNSGIDPIIIDTPQAGPSASHVPSHERDATSANNPTQSANAPQSTPPGDDTEMAEAGEGSAAMPNISILRKAKRDKTRQDRVRQTQEKQVKEKEGRERQVKGNQSRGNQGSQAPADAPLHLSVAEVQEDTILPMALEDESMESLSLSLEKWQ
jgi:hypothetical protein